MNTKSIRFAVASCSLGVVLVAATKRGVCAIEFGNDADALVLRLRNRFPKAELIAGESEAEKLAARVVAQIDQPRRDFSLPLDVRGTAFQERVWRALEKVPVGATVSYAGIARRIGAPRAVRAVAQACGANPTAVVIPCHRVVRTDGTSGGYRWGIARKEALLERELVA